MSVSQSQVSSSLSLSLSLYLFQRLCGQIRVTPPLSPHPQPSRPTQSSVKSDSRGDTGRTTKSLHTHLPSPAPLPPSLYSSDRRQRVTPSTHTLPLHNSTNSLFTHLPSPTPLPPSLYTSDRRQRVTPSTHTLPQHTSTNSLYKPITTTPHKKEDFAAFK